MLSLVMGILLVGVVSAGLLDYFGRIEGEVEVSGPVFYAGEDEQLFINIFNSEYEANYYISEYTERRFKTIEFDELINFYGPKVNLSVNAKLNSGSSPKKLDLIFGYFDSLINGDYEEICRVSVNITNESDYRIYSDVCDYNLDIENVGGFYYSIKGRSSGDVKIGVSAKGETKVEIIGVAS